MHRLKNTNRQFHFLFPGLMLIFLLLSGALAGQETQDAQKDKEAKKLDQVKAFFNNQEHSATKAIVYSALIPGWGQAYNKKYWKIPIVYTGIAGAAYFIKTNSDDYKLYKSDYLLLVEDPEAQTVSEITSLQQLKGGIDQSRRNRDLSIIALFAWYGLGLIDANVDGHFFNYDIDDDLSMWIDPWIKPWLSGPGEIQQGMGVSVNFSFR